MDGTYINHLKIFKLLTKLKKSKKIHSVCCAINLKLIQFVTLTQFTKCIQYATL